ncbi:MAG: type II toxin-antitoxin system RelE/ParE family toxin [Gammaproteobacteria bacterium]|nr:type II toxin-antitoxin system RelE/ParE family toxin [Gammaproteobacteria bacterium]MXY05502.1 type II toxin-antitoxin system RelE/ParE family toxin [Gammaproteobacteria bacterium]MYE52434.1 type II toxin-antitoxin system RelE/ParE family toxin [Gammaproteobacteria bacterium]MYF12054.1 type II toxin-antitoxin system RelE/ParE family toxin [Gammaproteobacteria bacterium]MYG13499.1 type II toxin-antitoxin system RelE/ParE family toxin [Gammaproteobacteria bacterium]
MRLKVPEETAALIRHSHPALKRRIREALRTIVEDPTSGKPLVDELQGLRSFRLGRIRIVYAINESDSIDIVTIGPRKRIYEETYRIISRK